MQNEQSRTRHQKPLIKRTGAAVVVLAFSLLAPSYGEGPSREPGVTARNHPKKPLCFEMALKAGDVKPSKLYKFRLPWGNYQSMVLAAVTGRGQALQRVFPIDDPGPGEVAVAANATFNGEFCPQYVFRDFEEAVQKDDVIVFWAYEAPEELGIPKWSGGWVLIPQQKTNRRSGR